jgi:hypothetical protein
MITPMATRIPMVAPTAMANGNPIGTPYAKKERKLSDD